MAKIVHIAIQISNIIVWSSGTLPTRVQILMLAPFLGIFSGFNSVMR
jgi:hypothetical protein